MEVVISNSAHSIKKTGLGLQTQTSTTTGCSKRTVTINLLNLGLNLPVAEQRFSFMNLLLGRRAHTGVFPSPVFIQSFANSNSRRSNVPQVMSALLILDAVSPCMEVMGSFVGSYLSKGQKTSQRQRNEGRWSFPKAWYAFMEAIMGCYTPRQVFVLYERTVFGADGVSVRLREALAPLVDVIIETCCGFGRRLHWASGIFVKLIICSLEINRFPN